MAIFEYNLSLEELEKRTNNDYLITKKFLTKDSKEYLSLLEGDKKALKYLVKAAIYIEKIFMRLDNEYNLKVKEWLEEECKKGNKKAILTKKLFDAQKGIFAIDTMTNTIQLVKGIKKPIGRGFYPEDLTKEEYHEILINMIKEGKIDEVKIIVNQRSVVVRDGIKLKGIDYVDYFREDFENVVTNLEEAAKVSTNKDFNEYLILQAKAFREANSMFDAYADKKWAELQYTPLEFTITRENYEDEMVTTIIENKILSDLLKKNGIVPVGKDSLGARVGIINHKGTDNLLKIKKYLPFLASIMPYNNEYSQIISNENESKQTMVDVDLVYCGGDVGAYRGGITLAENLPNDDKLSLTIGGGRRNVYHRQIRFVSDYKKLQEKLDMILDKEQHKFYYDEASHWTTIGHENAHSLGPKIDNSKLGQYSHIIEENKADMASLAFIDILTEKGMYTMEQRNQMIVTEVVDNFLKAKPDISQAHRVRTVMQNKYLFDHGAYELTQDNKIHVNIDKVCNAAKSMLYEIIRIQLDEDHIKAEEYVNRNFVWTNEMNIIAEKLQKVNKYLNGTVETELADELINT